MFTHRVFIQTLPYFSTDCVMSLVDNIGTEHPRQSRLVGSRSLDRETQLRRYKPWVNVTEKEKLLSLNRAVLSG